MRWLRAVAGLAVLSVVVSACAASRRSVDASAQPVELVTTILPMTLFARAVAGPCARVTPLIPPQVSPHEFAASPSTLIALRRASLLVENGMGMESFLEPLIASAGNPRLRRVNTSAAVAPVRVSSTPGHHHGGPNPHVWLDPLRAVQQVSAIRDALLAVDPACAAGYRQRAAAYISELRRLDHDIARRLAPYRGQTFVAFHDVAPYFAERYQLNVQFLVDIPEHNPSAAELARVARLVQRSQLRALMSEPQQGDRSFNRLAQDMGVRIGLFNPVETGDEQSSRDPYSYIATMRSNGRNLAEAFSQ